MRIAQLSDIHVPDFVGVTPRDFMNKRITGALNLLTGRRGAHPLDITERLIEDVTAQGLDHVLVTGDITNLSLPGEFQRVSRLLRLLGGYDRLTVIPGNHDVYTHGAERQRRFLSYFGEVLFRDAGKASDFPAIKDLGDVVVAGLCSAIATPPLMAYGRVSEAQLEALRTGLGAASNEGKYKVVMVHHNLHDEPSRWHRLTASLRNKDAVIDACFDAKVDLVLHGHTHRAHRFQLTRGDHTLTITGSGSSTQASHDPDRVARYNIYAVNGKSMRMRTRVYDLAERRFTWLV